MPRVWLLAMLVTVAGAFVAHAAEPAIPRYWDTGERMTKPDLTSLGRLRFLTTTGFPPFDFLDDRGNLTGFNVDLARAICAELALGDKCQIQALPWNELDGAMEKRQGEAIIAGISITAATRRRYSFSRPYLQFPARFIMPKATALSEPIFSKLAGLRIGVVAGSAHEHMLHDDFPGAKAVAYDHVQQLYDDLRQGKLDGAFGDGMQFGFWLAGTDSHDCCRFAGGPYVAPAYLGQGMAIATPRDDATLAQAMNYALQKIGEDGKFAELYLRYFPVGFY